MRSPRRCGEVHNRIRRRITDRVTGQNRMSRGFLESMGENSPGVIISLPFAPRVRLGDDGLGPDKKHVKRAVQIFRLDRKSVV